MATLTELLFEVVDSVDISPTFKIVSNEPQMSIERKMIELEENPYHLICGNPLDGRLYLVTDIHIGLNPDLLFEHRPFEEGSIDRLYAFLIPNEVG